MYEGLTNSAPQRLQIIFSDPKGSLRTAEEILSAQPSLLNRGLDDRHRTALIISAKNNDSIKVKFLLTKKSLNTNARDKGGYTALIWASLSGHSDVVSLLLGHPSVNVNAQSNSGYSALMKASENGQIEVVKLLLLHPDINTSLTNKKHKNAMQVACEASIWLTRIANRNEKKAIIMKLIEDHSAGIRSNRKGGFENNLTYMTDPVQDLGRRKQDTHAIEVIASLQQALARGKKEWRRGKVMIVGEGRAGKTALANALLGRSFQDLPSTVGINYFTCSVASVTAKDSHRPSKGYRGGSSWFEVPDLKSLEYTISRMILDLQKEKEKLNTSDRRGVECPPEVVGRAGLLSDEIFEGDTLNARGEAHIPLSNTTDTNSTDEETRKGFTAEKGKVDPTRAVSKEEINSSLLSKYLKEKHLESNLMISIFDFGGQSVFNVIHPLFFTKFGVYIIAFNMEWLHSSACDAVKERCLKLLSFWINSVIVHTCDDNANVAPIFFVGTRKDLVSSTSDHEEISLLLYQSFSTSIGWPFVVPNDRGDGTNGRVSLYFFPVDNRQGFDDITVRVLSDAIETSIDSMSYVRTERPLTWFKFLDALKSLSVPCISYLEAEHIAEGCGIHPSTVPATLRFFHEMGMVVWHDESVIRNMVVLDPIRGFVQPATRIICKHSPTAEDKVFHVDAHRALRKGALATDFTMMKSLGILSEALFMAFLNEETPEATKTEYQVNTQFVKAMMCKHGLIVPLFLNEKAGIDAAGLVRPNEADLHNDSIYYLVPALLPPLEHSTVSIFWHRKVATQLNIPASRCFAFLFAPSIDAFQSRNSIFLEECCTMGFYPSGLFERLLAKAVCWSGYTTRPLNWSDRGSIRCFQKCAELAFGSQRFSMLLDDRHNMISVVVLEGNHPAAIHNRLRELIIEIIKECWKYLHFSTLIFVPSSLLTTDNSAPSPLSAPIPTLSPPRPPPLEYDEFRDRLVFLSSLRSHAKKFSSVVLPRSQFCDGSLTKLAYIDAEQHYEHWLVDFRPLKQYDLYLSYRWGIRDSEFVQALFDRLSVLAVDEGLQRPVLAFLDKVRLPSGDHFQSQFVHALFQSVIVVPIVSTDALQRMLSLAPHEEDNVLIEWICALSLIRENSSFRRGKSTKQSDRDNRRSDSRLLKILPVFFGSREFSVAEGKVGRNLFAEEIIENLSTTIVPTRCLEIARTFLAECGADLCEEIFQWSLQKIVKEVTKYKAICAWNFRELSEILRVVTEEVALLLTECFQYSHQTGKISPAPDTSCGDESLAVPSDSKANSVPAVIDLVSKKQALPSLSELVDLIRQELDIAVLPKSEVIRLALDDLSADAREKVLSHETMKEQALTILQIIGYKFDDIVGKESM